MRWLRTTTQRTVEHRLKHIADLGSQLYGNRNAWFVDAAVDHRSFSSNRGVGRRRARWLDALLASGFSFGLAGAGAGEHLAWRQPNQRLLVCKSRTNDAGGAAFAADGLRAVADEAATSTLPALLRGVLGHSISWDRNFPFTWPNQADSGGVEDTMRGAAMSNGMETGR